MAKRRKFILFLQAKNGGGPKVVFEITEQKAQKIIDLIQPEINKKKDKMPTPSVTLDPFFIEEN